MRVQLYRNLAKSREYNVWSLTHAKPTPCSASNGKVYDYGDVVLLGDCCFVVSEAGRQRVLRLQKKKVHAWVEGELLDLVQHPSNVDLETLPDDVYDGRWIPITYNPYKGPDFIRRDTGKPIAHAEFVAATPSGIMAQGLTGLRGIAGLGGPVEDDGLFYWNG